MKITRNWMIRWTLVMSSLVLVIPFQGVHHFFEHHEDDVHVCDYETCVRKEIVDCDLCEFVKTGSKYIYTQDGFSLNIQLQTTFQVPCCFQKSKHRGVQKNKGPPYRNDTSTT